MKNILREISIHYHKSNEDDRKLTTYLAMREHPGWKVHQEFLFIIRGKMAEELLSDRFTKLDKEEKDAMQRAYAYSDEMIRFLLNPVEKAMKRAIFSANFDRAIKQQEATRNREQPER